MLSAKDSSPTHFSANLDGFPAALRSEASRSLALLPDEQLRKLCHQLPKIDIHQHLEGAIDPETFFEIAKRHQIPLPVRTLEELRPLLQVGPQDRSLIDFLKKFALIGDLFYSAEIVEELTLEQVRTAAKENLIHLELRLSPAYIAKAHQLDLDQVVESAVQGAKRGQAETGVLVKLLLIVERQMGQDHAWEIERLALRHRGDFVVGIDLANDEYHYPPGPYGEVFRAARRDGLRTTAHAGEAGGAENVRVALNDLQVERIGHGIRAYEDPEVARLVIDRKIPLEVCLTSNLQTQAVAEVQQSPFDRHYRAGGVATINTDDPGISGITLTSELMLAVKTFGYSLADLRELTLYAAKSAFVSDSERVQLVAAIEKGFALALQWLLKS